MSTKFAPAKKSTKRPAVCRKGAVGLPAAYVGGIPASLSVFCLATQTSGYDRIAESFRLIWDPANKAYYGASAQTGLNLYAIVHPLPAKDMYDLHLYVRQDQLPIGQHFWDDVHIAAGPPWDSGLLNHPPIGGAGGFQLHALN